MQKLSYRHRRLIQLRRLLLGSLVPCLLLACTDAPDTQDADRPVRDDPEMLQLRRDMLERKLPERATKPPSAMVGEVPADVMATALMALEKLTGAQRSEFETVRAEEVMWPDGALGCGQPGMTYTQAPVAGYHIVLRHNGREYDYRAGGISFLMLCLEPGIGVPSGSTAPVL